MTIIAHTAPSGIAQPCEEREGHGFLTHDELICLITRFLSTRAHGGATEEEITAVADWAHGVKVGATALKMVLSGELLIDLEDSVPTLALPEARYRDFDELVADLPEARRP
jgi:hypothetical protein